MIIKINSLEKHSPGIITLNFNKKVTLNKPKSHIKNKNSSIPSSKHHGMISKSNSPQISMKNSQKKNNYFNKWNIFKKELPKEIHKSTERDKCWNNYKLNRKS